jgi:hypothetical protein
MLKKKISSKDWTYIGRYNYAAKWLRPLCSYSLIKENDNMFRREQKVGWHLYLILFIPVHVLQALWCLWDGGLKEFEINKRYLGSDVLVSGSECFMRAEEIWNNKNN